MTSKNNEPDVEDEPDAVEAVIALGMVTVLAAGLNYGIYVSESIRLWVRVVVHSVTALGVLAAVCLVLLFVWGFTADRLWESSWHYYLPVGVLLLGAAALFWEAYSFDGLRELGQSVAQPYSEREAEYLTAIDGADDSRKATLANHNGNAASYYYFAVVATGTLLRGIFGIAACLYAVEGGVTILAGTVKLVSSARQTFVSRQKLSSD